MEEYLKSDDVSHDSASVKIVIEYLKALNSSFEMSLLGKYVRVFSGNTLQRMEDGFRFFKTWCEDAIENGLYIGCNFVFTLLYLYLSCQHF